MINIVEIQQSMIQGMTKPRLCVGDDDMRYIVKRRNAGFEGCIAEWIAGNLGQKFGLNIPDVALVNIDETLIQYDVELQATLGAGTAFASKYQHGTNEVNLSDLRQAPPKILIDLYVFDYWIKNDDRTLTENGGNPNLYQDLTNRALVVFDHNLAFDEIFELQSFRQTHVSSFLFKGQRDLFEKLIDRSHYEKRLSQTMAQLDDIVSTILDDWLEEFDDPSGEIERLRLILEKFSSDNSWEALI